MSRIGVVVIGRNEGERLRQCLASSLRGGHRVVYVDSGSSDGSAALARTMGVETVELDPARPFTAARGRNEGFERLMQVAPQTQYVQFVDGDCELVEGWLDAAAAHLDEQGEVTVVCGRLRERHPEATIYNRLCEMEWNGPAGEIRACGGIAMMRAAAFAQAGGFNENVIAAEDDELCVRLRQGGGRLWRLERDMAWHDAAMTRFGQWWRRAVRAGHAFAQVHGLHGGSSVGYFRRELRSAWLWGAVMPLAFIAALATGWWWAAAGVVALYAVQIVRIWRATGRRGHCASHAGLYAVHCVAAKGPQLQGICLYHLNRLRRRPSRIIEHKRVDPVHQPTGAPGEFVTRQ